MRDTRGENLIAADWRYETPLAALSIAWLIDRQGDCKPHEPLFMTSPYLLKVVLFGYASLAAMITGDK
jgi:hypothetical protein